MSTDTYKSISQIIFLKDVVVGPHPSVFMPNAFKAGAPAKFFATLAYKNDHFENIQTMTEALLKNKEAVKTLTPNVDVEKINTSLDSTGDGPDEYTKIRARSGEQYPPELVKQDARTRCAPSDIYTGCIVNAKIEIKIYEVPQTKELNTFFRLFGLQKIADGTLPHQLTERVGPQFTPVKED